MTEFTGDKLKTVQKDCANSRGFVYSTVTITFRSIFIFIADRLGDSEQHQSSTEQSCDQPCVALCSRSSSCHLTCLQPICEPAGPCVHPRSVRKSTLFSKACHSHHIKTLIVLTVALQRTPAVALHRTQTASLCH